MSAQLAGAAPDDAQTAWLCWTDAAGSEQRLALDHAVTIGRSVDNLLRLRDDRVSRHHATVTLTTEETGKAEYTITDLGSSNGTTVNGTPVAPRIPLVLRSGDQIAIGETTLAFEAPASGPPTAPTRIVAATMSLDGSAVFALAQTAGWIELPNGERRILGVETRIGRSNKNDIQVNDDLISRNHVHIRRIDNHFVLSDLGSANGVRINGEPVLMPRELRDGDVIELGKTTLRFSLTSFSESAADIPVADSRIASETQIINLFKETSAATVGELREVTVLFCDMHGYTAMSERLNNPEQTTIIINQVFEKLTAEIVKYDGSIDKYTGDNIMAIFGAPQAHEDDPERAIQAALGMQRALDLINRKLRRELGLTLEIRIGINSGEVLYGQVGGGAFRSNTVMGDTVNLASRLEHASRVGYITVGESTYARARSAFIFTVLPPMDIRGKREPVQAYEVVRERRIDESLQAPVGTDYLIGRENELSQLRAALADVRAGHGRLLAVVGDAGIGKGQLLAAFRRSEGGTLGGGAWIVERCLSYETSAPYALLGGVLRSLLRLDGEETLDRSKLLAAYRTVLPGASETNLAEWVALTGQLLGVRVNDAPIAGLEAKVRRKLLMTLVRSLITARIYPDGPERPAQPLTMSLEEMQWADTASIEALDELVEAVPGVPLLLILTYRPEWSHTWSGRSFYRQINLGELAPDEGRLFLRSLLREAELSDAVANSIIAQCGNNPLLLEETAKNVRDRGLLVVQDGWWTLTADVSLLNIPSTLRGMMMARMDRLSEQDRDVLQKAAVIGRSFTYRLLALLTGLDDVLDESLARLKDAEFIVEHLLAAEPEYGFKHAIVQEIAYNTILAAERRSLHEQVGAAIERIFGVQADDQLETLAYHYSRSGAKRQAVVYLLRSGEKARRLYANATAIAQFEEALDKLRSMSPQELAQDATLPVRLHEDLGDAYLLTADFVRAQERYEAGLSVAGAPAVDRARLWNKLGRVWAARGDFRKALRSYEQGMAVLGAQGASAVLANLQVSAARAHVQMGEHERATTLAHAALALTADQTEEMHICAQADALYVLGQTAYAAGRVSEAIERQLRGLALRETLGDTAGMQECFHEAARICWSRGRLSEAVAQLANLTAALRYGSGDTDPGPTEDSLIEASRAGGLLTPVERYYRSALRVAEGAGDRWGVALAANRIGTLLFHQGETNRALDYLQKAVVEAERIGAREVAAAASITLGAIFAVQGSYAAGIQHLERAITMAEAVESAVVLATGRLRLAEARLSSGDLAGATSIGQEGFLLATRIGHQLTLGLANRILGRIANARGDWAMGERHFRLAIDLFARVEAQHEIGRALLDATAPWRDWQASGNGPLPDAALTTLRQAEEIFARLDMRHELRVTQQALAGH
ncbi:MAG TPA: FHA domain-containing protein [Thermomicrobiales bacterium]|nr:FHA domain-containing protein [Thermomicrobiales bacterium]